MMTLRHISVASTKRERERERERVGERERDKTCTRKRRQETLTNKETGIFSMMGFDSATSSFPALLVNKTSQ